MSYIMKTNYASPSNYNSADRKVTSNYYIVWHYTANDGDSDEANAKYFKTGGRNASAHYFVDDDSVTLSVPVNRTAWSVGGSKYPNCGSTGGGSLYGIAKNSNTINIELCDTNRNGKYDVSDATLSNAIELTKSIMAQYGIPLSHVIRHFDVTGKSCPAWALSATTWAGYKARIGSVVAPAPTPSTVVKEVEITPIKPTKGSYPESDVESIQKWLNNNYISELATDGKYGNQTKKAICKAVQKELGVVVDGDFGKASIAAANIQSIKTGSNGILVVLWQVYLVCNKFNPNGIDGIFGKGCVSATKAYQKSKSLSQSATVDGKLWAKALS